MSEGPVPTERGCTHPQCRRRHPHAGPAILNREDAFLADRAEQPDDDGEPAGVPGGGPNGAASARAEAIKRIRDEDWQAATACALTSLAFDVAQLVRAQGRGGR